MRRQENLWAERLRLMELRAEQQDLRIRDLSVAGRDPPLGQRVNNEVRLIAASEDTFHGTFEAKPSEGLKPKDFIDAMRRRSAENNWSETVLMTTVVHSMRGNAKTWLHNLLPSEIGVSEAARCRENWEAFQVAFKRKYIPRETLDIMNRDTMQRSNESARAFIDRVCQAVVKDPQVKKDYEDLAYEFHTKVFPRTQLANWNVPVEVIKAYDQEMLQACRCLQIKKSSLDAVYQGLKQPELKMTLSKERDKGLGLADCVTEVLFEEDRRAQARSASHSKPSNTHAMSFEPVMAMDTTDDDVFMPPALDDPAPPELINAINIERRYTNGVSGNTKAIKLKDLLKVPCEACGADHYATKCERVKNTILVLRKLPNNKQKKGNKGGKGAKGNNQQGNNNNSNNNQEAQKKDQSAAKASQKKEVAEVSAVGIGNVSIFDDGLNGHF
jgi:hypothetical protein